MKPKINLIYFVLFFCQIIFISCGNSQRASSANDENIKLMVVIKLEGKLVELDLSDYRLHKRVIKDKLGISQDVFEYRVHKSSLMYVYDLEFNLKMMIYDFGSGIIGDEEEDYVLLFPNVLYRKHKLLKKSGQIIIYDETPIGRGFKLLALKSFEEANEICKKVRKILLENW